MALLQSLGPHVQTMASSALIPQPYSVGPFVQPMTDEVVPLPAALGGPGGGFVPVLPVCPPGTYWDPVRQCCVPFAEEETEEALTASVVEPPSLPHYAVNATAAAIALTIKKPKGYEVLAAEIGLILDRDHD